MYVCAYVRVCVCVFTYVSIRLVNVLHRGGKGGNATRALEIDRIILLNLTQVCGKVSNLISHKCAEGQGQVQKEEVHCISSVLQGTQG